MSDPTESQVTTPPTEGWEAIPVGSPSPELPQKIGRYRVEQLLGVGGFGQVFLAHDDDLGRTVAVKVPHRQRISQPEDIAQYMKEARLLASLDHPNIVPVYDVGCTDDGSCFIVSKLIEGSDLTKRIRKSPLSFIEVAKLTATVAEALHYAHQKGLVHRDVKPANILLDRNDNPYIVDFGLALKEEDFGKGACAAGTPAYMSPEQARGDGNRVDGRSDIFSLGVVLYEMLTERRPFQGLSYSEIQEQITTVEPRPPRQLNDAISKELERICLKALSKRPSERYTTAKDMADDLKQFVAQETSQDDVFASIHSNNRVRSKSSKFHFAFQMRKMGCAVTVTLAALLLMIVPLVRDSLLSTRMVAESDTTNPLLKLSFDNLPGRIPKLTFGLQMRDPDDPKNWVKLTWDDLGQTNSTMLRVDDHEANRIEKEYVLGEGKITFDTKALKSIDYFGMEGAWTTNDPIYVTQTVQLIPGNAVESPSGDTKRFLDTCLVRFTIENKAFISKRTHKVGLRFLLDTYIGDTDGPTFAIPGQNKLIDTQLDLTKPESIPDFLLALAKPTVAEPVVVAQIGLHLGPKIESPSRVSLTRYPGGRVEADAKLPSLFNYEVPMANINLGADKKRPDSAVVLYWADQEMKPGDVRTLGFTYGIGKLDGKSGIGVTVDGNKAPGGELTVAALVNDAEKRQTLTLKLPETLRLVSGAETQPVPASVDGRPSPVTWKVQSSVEGLYQIRVESSNGVNERRYVKIQQSKLF